jgi:hypothetical protein
MSFENRFGWSFSREATFDACRRRYYFHYYLSWGGWEADAPPVAREAFRLKRLVSLPLWRGQLVHYVASTVLRSMRAKGKIPDKDKVLAYTLERFETQLEFSRSKRYRWTSKKRGGSLNIDWLALIDHEYDRPIAPADVERTRAECLEAIEGLYESGVLGTIMDTNRGDWDIEDIDGGSFSQQFDVGGVRIFVQTDFLYRGGDGTLRIVDWKTNREAAEVAGENERRPNAAAQLGVYAYYAARVLREPVSSIRLYEVNLLGGGRITEHEASESSIERAGRAIEDGIAKLSSVLIDGDTVHNKPLDAAQFPATEDARCGFCNFQRICKGERSPNLDL